MSNYRIETDSFGAIQVADSALWGAQTQRSLMHFHISTERMPPELMLALARVKRACAASNQALGLIDSSKANAIIAAADEVLAGQHAAAFPLLVWQTGSGTQSNMNMNEVLANRASELLGGSRGAARLLHPNDDVNLGQSSNDIFPTAMHVAAAQGMQDELLPNLARLIESLRSKSAEFADIVKIGRTHLQDATPITLGQEISGWYSQLEHAERMLKLSLPSLCQLAVGGTAVGTGLNTHPQFGARVAAELALHTGLPFESASNKFAALAGHDAMVSAHGAMKTLATALIKIANDIRWLASGPRCGLGELQLPENEPGSSIMPGKVNPTQCEAMTMLCCQVLGNDVAISIGAASGNFELNVFKPLIAYNFLQSLRLLRDGMASLTTHCIVGISAQREHIAALLEQSLMLVTALSPHLGYDQSAEIAKYALKQNCTLKQAALDLGLLTGEQFDTWVNAKAMTHS
ncbi:class II fumarate hydratase [Deefgea piscis]|uniref:Fumarate hydratase class II n=1 Tax=Deefgea piscis TaxID=2739061 RepID=A0A6M8SUR1_9NEIS|nr:class II fumarate hydratase [Deefgea piscis]QKJ67070.1 class II fumarate hydratase [Deefgea piscis]